MILFFAPVLILAVLCFGGVAVLPEKVLRRYSCRALFMRCQAGGK